MNNKLEAAFAVAVITCMIVASIIACLWTLHWVGSGVRNWWHAVTYVSPEDRASRQAEIDRENAEWAVDPRNPKVVAQRCLDRGGTPTFSAWDGNVTSCKGAEGKSVNIEVNQ